MIEPTPTPTILPAHIEETIRSIAELHASHHRRTTPVQRAVDRLTAIVGRPSFIGAMTAVLALWVGFNVLMSAAGARPLDPPPFSWLATAASVVALYVTVMILTTQRRENTLAQLREQLTLELAIVSEQKTAKTIALLEEMRRDSPHLPNRIDEEAADMATPADPSSVFEAIRETNAEAEGLSDIAAVSADRDADDAQGGLDPTPSTP